MFWTKFWKNAINNLLVHFSVNNRLKLKQCSFHKGRLTKAWRGGGGFEWILASLSHKILLPYYVTHIKFSIVFNMTFIKTCVVVLCCKRYKCVFNSHDRSETSETQPTRDFFSPRIYNTTSTTSIEVILWSHKSFILHSRPVWAVSLQVVWKLFQKFTKHVGFPQFSSFSILRTRVQKKTEVKHLRRLFGFERVIFYLYIYISCTLIFISF